MLSVSCYPSCVRHLYQWPGGGDGGHIFQVCRGHQAVWDQLIHLRARLLLKGSWGGGRNMEFSQPFPREAERCRDAGWGWGGQGAAVGDGTGRWQAVSWAGASRVPRWQQRPAVPGVVSAADGPESQGRAGIVPSPQCPSDRVWELPLVLSLSKMALRWGPCPAKRHCKTGAASTGGRDSFRGMQQQLHHQWEGRKRRSWALHSSAWQGSERQGHKLPRHERCRPEIRRSLFPMRTHQWWSRGQGRLDCLKPWEVLCLSWVKTWPVQSDPMAELALDRSWGCRAPQKITLPAWIVLWCYDLWLMYGYMNCRTQPDGNSKRPVEWPTWRLVPSVWINMAADGEWRVYPVSLHVLRSSSSMPFKKNHHCHLRSAILYHFIRQVDG